MAELFLAPPTGAVILGGVTLLLLLGLQVLIGYRKIKFAPRSHWRVHKGVAWTIVIVAAVHALTALVYVGILPL